MEVALPIYEYQCEKCQHDFEQLIRNEREEQSLTCPKCGERRVERRLSVFAARAAAQPTPLPRGGGCGRCGDPGGPCGAG